MKSAAAPRVSATVTGIAEAMTIKFNTKVYELKRAGKQICALSLGDGFFNLSVVDTSDLPYPAVHYYSDSRGIPELRRAIARYYEGYGLLVDPDREIILTAGSKAAIYMALLATVDPGEQVLIPEPAWVSYTEQVRLVRGEPVGIPYDVPLDQWERYVTPRTKALIINNPHNPTGYRYREDEIRRLVDLARERGLWLLSDEAYSDFAFGGGFVSTGHFDPAKDNVVVFNSFSKNHGVSGWRVGYSIAGPALTNQILKINQHLVTCPPTILEYYLASHFDDILEITKPQIEALLDARARIARFMDGIGLRYLPGDSTFYFFVSIAATRLSSEEFCMRLLEEHHISTVPGIGYGASCDGFLRVSLGSEPVERIQSALKTLKDLVVATS